MSVKKTFKLVNLDVKSAATFILWSSLVFFSGFLAGYLSPSDNEAKIRQYAIMLEIENSRINKILKSCNRR